jgi:restriction system protein
MAKTQMWMVRAGEGGYLFDEFRDGNFVAIGWNEIGDLTDITSQEEIHRKYLADHPDEHAGKVGNAVAVIYKFREVLKPGDKVITYNPETRQYLVGTIKGDYQYDPSKKYQHLRSVEWLGTVDRDALKPSSRNSLGSTLTLFQLNEETTEDVLAALHGRRAAPAAESDQKGELEQLKEDTISRAHELIKDKIQRLDEDEMEELVAAILRAMGYKARLTVKTGDGGIDVIASPDGLGLEEPRIKAEVKHRKSQMGTPDIRSFVGGLRAGDRGLYVSTGGFSKDAQMEALRSNIPITLVTLDDLASLVVDHYEKFDIEGRVLIPLTRLYWPAE